MAATRGQQSPSRPGLAPASNGRVTAGVHADWSDARYDIAASPPSLSPVSPPSMTPRTPRSTCLARRRCRSVPPRRRRAPGHGAGPRALHRRTRQRPGGPRERRAGDRGRRRGIPTEPHPDRAAQPRTRRLAGTQATRARPGALRPADDDLRGGPPRAHVDRGRPATPLLRRIRRGHSRHRARGGTVRRPPCTRGDRLATTKPSRQSRLSDWR